LLWPADDGVEPDVRVEAALVGPSLLSILELDDPRRPLCERARESPFEEVRGLDEMVVDRDDRDADLPRLGIAK
jgi:hypothetical protein